MRIVLFRVLAAILALTTLATVPIMFLKNDFREEYPFGIYTLIAGVILIVPTFLTYAIRGESAGNRVLVWLTRLLALPQTLADKLIKRYVKVPDELSGDDAVKPLPRHHEDSRLER